LVMTQPRRAVILAAGFGTRLWPLTIGRTKPALPFLNRPLIAFTIEYLRRYGFTDLIINLHHEPASVREQIGDGSRYGVRISYSLEEPEILGTAGALDAVRDRLTGGTFVVINGKIITDIDLKAALDTHRRSGALATLVLKPNLHREHFREVLMDGTGRVTGFGQFPDREAKGDSLPLMFTGIHLMEPEIFEFIPRGVFSDSVKDVYPQALAAGKVVAGHVGAGDWYELSTIERYLAISLELSQHGGGLVVDEGCRIDPTAVVTNSVLWKRVEVGPGVRLDQCIVGDDVRIPAGSSYQRAVICRGTEADLAARPEKAWPGAITGDNLVVPFS
ncbi:MAG: sugar phosphate nucleotidyltransferase, partial [Blastocatellia bacterium]